MALPSQSTTIVKLSFTHHLTNFHFPKFYMFLLYLKIFYLFLLYAKLTLFLLNSFLIIFFVKDLKTKVSLIKREHREVLYHIPHPSTNPYVFHTTPSSHPPWYHIFGHPFDRNLHHLIYSHQIRLSSIQQCISCSTTKSHKHPFNTSSITTAKPLELLVYVDVWGPSPTRSLDDFLYYLVLFYHFSKYT